MAPVICTALQSVNEADPLCRFVQRPLRLKYAAEAGAVAVFHTLCQVATGEPGRLPMETVDSSVPPELYQTILAPHLSWWALTFPLTEKKYFLPGTVATLLAMAVSICVLLVLETTLYPAPYGPLVAEPIAKPPAVVHPSMLPS